jgi:hypothetical protein
MMRALILLHRWLGVAFCLLFAMWFASGIVMHFVPFPEPSEAARLAGLAPLDLASAIRGPGEAVSASGFTDVQRVRLTQRSDGPVYLVTAASGIAALHAADLSSATVHSPALALAIAKDHAGRRFLDSQAASVAALQSYDQWTVAGAFERDRPLYRIALHDRRGTDLYVAAATGDVALETSRSERVWNYAGSIPHWIYATALRRHAAVWSRFVWWLSLIALIGAGAGAILGLVRLRGDGLGEDGASSSRYRGWQRWHHWLGLCCAIFLLSWVFSGWLSMDDGTLFSTGRPTDAEIFAVTGVPDWHAMPPNELQHIGPQIVEAEWFAFGGKIYRRERTASDTQRLAGLSDMSDHAFLDTAEVATVGNKLSNACEPPRIVDDSDGVDPAAALPNVPIYRLVCGDIWFDIDGGSGALLGRLDPSYRISQRLFGTMHRLDFPFLTARPVLRTTTIVVLCGFGFAFSLTGVVIAWRRLRSCCQPASRQR